MKDDVGMLKNDQIHGSPISLVTLFSLLKEEAILANNRIQK